VEDPTLNRKGGLWFSLSHTWDRALASLPQHLSRDSDHNHVTNFTDEDRWFQSKRLSIIIIKTKIPEKDVKIPHSMRDVPVTYCVVFIPTAGLKSFHKLVFCPSGFNFCPNITFILDFSLLQFT